PCYNLELIGAWSAKGPGLSATGYIRSVVIGGGIGADATAAVEPAQFPSSVQLKDFAWHANSGGAPIPDLVNADIDGVRIRVSTNYLTFPGVSKAVVTLTAAGQ